MKYLLDTCVVSDFVKGDPSTLNHIKKTSPNHIAISSITLMEIEYGLALNKNKAAQLRSVIHDFLAPITILNFTSDDAAQAALLRALLKQQGNPIGAYDILLAGTALNHKLTFVSSNTNEFDRINGLKLENWRE